MKLFILSCAILTSSLCLAEPVSYQGNCVENKTGNTQGSDLTLDFESFPNSLDIVLDGAVTKVEYKKPADIGQDMKIVLDKIQISPRVKFSLITYGTTYVDSTSFLEVTQDYKFDAEKTNLEVQASQKTYKQGEVEIGQSWDCKYTKQ